MFNRGAFERIDIAEYAGVSKVEFDDIVAVVEWCAWVWPQGRFLSEGHGRTRCRRRTDARSGYSGGAGAEAAAETIGVGRKELLLVHKVRQTQPQLAERTVRSDGIATGEEDVSEGLSRTTQIQVAEGARRR
jgi:hypothetical protein